MELIWNTEKVGERVVFQFSRCFFVHIQKYCLIYTLPISILSFYIMYDNNDCDASKLLPFHLISQLKSVYWTMIEFAFALSYHNTSEDVI